MRPRSHVYASIAATYLAGTFGVFRSAQAEDDDFVTDLSLTMGGWCPSSYFRMGVWVCPWDSAFPGQTPHAGWQVGPLRDVEPLSGKVAAWWARKMNMQGI